MRSILVAMALVLFPLSPAVAQVSIQIGLPGINIGINQPVYPQLVQVPGYPVYYDPSAGSNYFFYDGLYWVYQGDSWYASDWYNGPWALVSPQYVPVFILRVPVRYYRHPPAYFRGWQPEGPPRWGERWGHDWERHHADWDRWDHASAPRPAPLPVYQREYVGDRYPQAPQQQQELRTRHYSYKPSDAEVRRVDEAQAARGRQQEQSKQQAQQQQAQQQERGKQQEQAKQQQQAQQQQAQQQERGKQQEQAKQQQQAQQQERGKQQQQAQQQQQGKQQEQAKQQQAQQQQGKQQEQAKQQQKAQPAQQQPQPEKGGQSKGQDKKQEHEQ